MKAQQLTFQNLIDINPRTGMISFHSKRMALMSTEALGILRRDLVSTLGMERAKGFLMRYGWACGYSAGEAIAKMFPWESKRELLLSGPALHTLEGIVTVEVDKLEFDDEKIIFCGYWRNSYEAEEHIRHFGHGDSPVCWTLVGYASGYVRKVYGREVLVKELLCRGKRDDYCYFMIKPVDEWDEHEREELRYYQAESLVTELDRMYNKIQTLNQTILRSEEVHKKLTDLMLEGKSLPNLLNYLAGVIDRSIVIEKDNLNEIVESSLRSEQHLSAYRRWKETKSAPAAVDAFPLQASGHRMGNLVVIGDKDLSQQERIIIDRSNNVFTVYLFHQRSIAQSIWKMKEDFFEDILDGNYDEKYLNRRALDLDIRIDSFTRVVALKVSPREETENVLHYILLKNPKLNGFLKRDTIVIIDNGQCDNRQARQFTEELKESLEKKFRCHRFYIGSGRAVHSLRELGTSYQDALRISEFLQLAYPAYTAIATFEQLEPIIFVVKGGDQEELIAFCRRTLGKLIEHDRSNQGSLLLTLKTLLDYNGNLRKTAKDLHLSITGLRYRLERIESLLGMDLKDGNENFKLQLALQIHFALQLISQNPLVTAQNVHEQTEKPI
jgi:predicted hydrocarbon binding protein